MRRRPGRLARTWIVPAAGLAACVSLLGAWTSARASRSAEDQILRVAMRAADLDSLDYALGVEVASWSLVDTTCGRLLTYRPAAEPSSRLRPDLATGPPRRTEGGRTLTFTLRPGLRFSDGQPVDAAAFEHAIERVLAPEMQSPWAAYFLDIVGADRVQAGKASKAEGVVAKGRILTIRLTRPVVDFVDRATLLCAVPPGLPVDPEGRSAFASAGPYYVADFRPGEKVVIRRNQYYGGSRPRRVDGFDVDLRVNSQEEALDRVERGDADWGWALPQVYLDPARRLKARYGANKRQFFVQPGSIFRGYAFNLTRPLFRDNPRLRQAVNFAIDRTAYQRAQGGPLSSRLTDQYLPFWMRGFKDAHIYPLARPNLARARRLAKGHTRSGKLLLYTIDLPAHRAVAQSIQQQLAKIGLSVRVRAFPRPAYFGKLMARGPYDLGFATWVADYDDPYAVLNVQLDGRFAGATNWSRLNSPTYNRLLRRAASLTGPARYRAYGELDARIAREAAPMAAVDFLNDPVLVSKRVGCVPPTRFELAALCLR